MQPWPAAGYHLLIEQLIDQTDKRRALQRQGGEAPQAVTVRAELVRLLLVKTRQLFQQLMPQRKPLSFGKQQRALARGYHQHIVGQQPGIALAIELALQALRVEATERTGEQGRQCLLQALCITQHLQLAQAFFTAALPARCERVEHLAAAKGALGTLVP
jgi:hypothetical protein